MSIRNLTPSVEIAAPIQGANGRGPTRLPAADGILAEAENDGERKMVATTSAPASVADLNLAGRACACIAGASRACPSCLALFRAPLARVAQAGTREHQLRMWREQRRSELAGALKDVAVDFRRRHGIRYIEQLAYLAGVDRADMHRALAGSDEIGIPQMERMLEALIDARAISTGACGAKTKAPAGVTGNLPARGLE